MLTFWPAPKIVADGKIPGNGRNTIASVRMRAGVPCSAAVMAQEAREREIKRWALLRAVGLAVAVGAALLAIGFPQEMMLILFAGAVLGSAMWIKSAGFRQELELQGHAVEIAAAAALYGEDELVYRGNEARRMLGWSAYGFQGWTTGRLVDELRKRHPEAVKWVAGNRGFLQAWKEKHG